MGASDWGTTFYGSQYDYNSSQLADFSTMIAKNLEGGKVDRSKMTVAQLKACCVSKDLKIPSKLTKKADILAFLQHYDSMSVKQLRDMAKAKGIKVPSKYTKNLIYPLLF
jgi:hypothetical protein